MRKLGGPPSTCPLSICILCTPRTPDQWIYLSVPWALWPTWASISGIPVGEGGAGGPSRAYNWHKEWTGGRLGEWALTHWIWCYLEEASVRSELDPTTSTWYLLLGEKKMFTYLLGVWGKLYFWCLRLSVLWEWSRRNWKLGLVFPLYLQSE